MEKVWERQLEPLKINFNMLQQNNSRIICISSMIYQLFPRPNTFTPPIVKDRLKQELSQNQSANVGFSRYVGGTIDEELNFVYQTVSYLWSHDLTERRLYTGAKGTRIKYIFSKKRGGFLEEGEVFEYRFLEGAKPAMEKFVRISGIRI